MVTFSRRDCFVFVIAFTLFLAIRVYSADQPSIITIMVDDMGYSDLGCYGSEIETPTLDKLATDGIRLTQIYNSV